MSASDYHGGGEHPKDLVRPLGNRVSEKGASGGWSQRGDLLLSALALSDVPHSSPCSHLNCPFPWLDVSNFYFTALASTFTAANRFQILGNSFPPTHPDHRPQAPPLSSRALFQDLSSSPLKPLSCPQLSLPSHVMKNLLRACNVPGLALGARIAKRVKLCP